MTVRLLVALLAALAAAPVTADAYWTAAGSGAGSATVATLSGGNQPTAAASGQNVTVEWTQTQFGGSPLGSFAGGGYTLTRYADGSSNASTPNSSCEAVVSGSGASLQCTEAAVPFGRWTYTVTPRLGSFSGSESPKSAAVAVATVAPSLTAVTAKNPATAQTTGGIELEWASVGEAAGYNVYRRTTAGSYDFNAPLNGSTPITATTYTDPGSGLAPGTTYHYVVRALAGSPVAESANSNSLSASTISRPTAPLGVSATAAAAARIDVDWSSVADVAGYNVYRRTSGGTYDYGAPLNGATLVSAVAYADLTAVNATTYRYVVRAVIIGAGGSQVESVDSAETPAVTADSVPPPVPTATSVTSGGNLWTSTNCSIASGTRYINEAGKASVGVSATIATPEAGQTVVFSATSAGSTPVTATVPAAGTTVSATLNLSPLLDGTVTLTTRSKDAAGNLSATTAPTNFVIKDTVVPALTASYSGGLAGLNPRVTGSSECGATVRAVKTAGGNVGAVFTTTISSGTSYSISVEGPLLGLGSVSYDVSSTDRAGNVSGVVSAGN